MKFLYCFLVVLLESFSLALADSFPAVLIFSGRDSLAFVQGCTLAERLSSKHFVIRVSPDTAMTSADRALQSLKRQTQVDSEAVFFMGFSSGSSLAIRMTIQHREAKGLLLFLSATDSLQMKNASSEFSDSLLSAGVLSAVDSLRSPVFLLQEKGLPHALSRWSFFLEHHLRSTNQYVDKRVFPKDSLTAGQTIQNIANFLSKMKDYVPQRLRPCSQNVTGVAFKEYSGSHFSLQIENDFLDSTRRDSLLQRISRAIPLIKETLDWPLDTAHYDEDSVVVYLYEYRCIPHGQDSYRHAFSDKPYTYLSLDRPDDPVPYCSYLHEIIHLIGWQFSNLWIREGLAVFLNDSLGGYSTFPNYGMDLDSAAELILSIQDTVPFGFVGKNGIPAYRIFASNAFKKEYYILSASFSRYLWRKLGRKTFLKIYRASDSEGEIQALTGKSMETWKQEWKTGFKNFN